jgi:hypothetical protein
VIEERQILLNEIRAAFIHMLTESKLSGIGYKLPKRRGDKPEWISSEYWKAGRIDWDRSELHCAHCSYQDVRIVPSREIRDEARRTFKASVKESGRSEKGRPTREPQIVTAWNALVAEGKMPKVGPLNSIFDLVRDKVHEMFDSEKPDHEGLGEKVSLSRARTVVQGVSPRQFENSINSLPRFNRNSSWNCAEATWSKLSKLGGMW